MGGDNWGQTAPHMYKTLITNWGDCGGTCGDSTSLWAAPITKRGPPGRPRLQTGGLDFVQNWDLALDGQIQDLADAQLSQDVVYFAPPVGLQDLITWPELLVDQEGRPAEGERRVFRCRQAARVDPANDPTQGIWLWTKLVQPKAPL